MLKNNRIITTMVKDTMKFITIRSCLQSWFHLFCARGSLRQMDDLSVTLNANREISTRQDTGRLELTQLFWLKSSLEIWLEITH